MAALADKGAWAPSTNTPTLVDGSGTEGWVYTASDSGTVDFGSGDITFVEGDCVVYTGEVWQRQPGETVQTDAANYDSLEAWAAKSEEDWTDEIYADVETPWGDDGILGALFDGLEQGKPFVVALIEAIIHQAFDTVSDVFDTIGDAFDSMASNFSGKWRDIIAAQSSADYANAQLGIMNRLISDLFDDAAGSLSADWSVSYTGPGGGTIKQDGHGNAWWDGFGGLYRIGHAIWVSGDTATDLQVVSTVMPSPVQAPKLGGDSWLRLIGRCDGTDDNYVYAEIGYDYATLGYRASGTDHELDTTSTATSNGDSWDYLIGSSTDDYAFTIKRNGVVVLSATDSGPASNKGAGYLSVGFAMRANDRNVFLSQTSPGTLAMFSADDQ